MYARILVPVDASAVSHAGLLEAVRLARQCGGALRLLHIVEQMPALSEAAVYGQTPDALAAEAAASSAALLARLRDEVAAGGVAVDTLMIEGARRPLHAVVEEQVEAWGAECVVLGTHGRRGVERLVAGSVAEQVVRHASVPVLLVRCTDRDAPDGEALQSIAAAIA